MIEKPTIRMGRGGETALRRALLRFGPKSRPGKASRFIRQLKSYQKEHPNLVVVLYLRVSSGPQEDSGNLDTYEWRLRRACKRLGIPIIAVFHETCSGWVVKENRGRLIGAAEFAREHRSKTGVPVAVLAPCTDRFVRNVKYNSKTNPDAMPTVWEFSQLRELTAGMILLTYLKPDLPPREVTSRRTKWGQRFKNRKGGRPRKLSRAQRNELARPEAMKLRKETGRGCCWIARQVKLNLQLRPGDGPSSRTVWKWLAENSLN